MTGMDAAGWDARYAATGQVWSAEPNAVAASLLADLPPGTALDVAAGEGRMALWLASLGWHATALDFSPVGLAKGQARAEGLDVTWEVADVTTADLGEAAYDLVLVLYLHLPRAVMPDVLVRCAAAVRPGGHLLVLGHDRDNLARGVGGPQNLDLLYDLALLAPPVGFETLRHEQVQRPVNEQVAIDTLLLARRA